MGNRYNVPARYLCTNSHHDRRTTAGELAGFYTYNSGSFGDHTLPDPQDIKILLRRPQSKQNLLIDLIAYDFLKHFLKFSFLLKGERMSLYSNY